MVRAALLCALALVTGQGLAHGPSSGLSHDAGAVSPAGAGQPSPAGSGTPSAGEPPAGTATSGATRPRRARPQLASGAAFDAQGRLWMVGLDHQMRLVLRVAPADQPPGLGPERRLEQVRESVAAEGESRPKIAFGPRGQAVIAWTTPLPRPYTGNIRMIRSEDGGARFGEPFTVHQDRQVITHRFESIAFDASGALHVLWIDKRDVEAMIAAGKIDEVARYCETDVVNTYRLWLIYELFRGAMTPEQLGWSERQLRDYVRQSKPGNPHLQAAMDLLPP